MSASDLHGLLPWYANATLSPAEAREFEEHLEDCEGCRAELSAMQQLRKEVRLHGESFFDDHPNAESLVGFVHGELPDPDARIVRKHLDLCDTCRVEADLVEKAAASRRARGARRLAPARWLPWTVAAASLLLAVSLITLGPSPEPRGTGAIETHIIEELNRGDAARIELQATTIDFQLILHVDFPPRSTVSVELANADDKTVFRGELQTSTEQYVFLYCDRAELPDGDYRVRVTRLDEVTEWRDYPFRIVTASPAGER